MISYKPINKLFIYYLFICIKIASQFSINTIVMEEITGNIGHKNDKGLLNLYHFYRL